MNEIVKKESQILEIISEIYIALIILFFPLIVDKTGFFRILECKWHWYLIIATTYLILIITTLIYFRVFKKIRYWQYLKFTWIQYFSLIFLLINIISCFASPFFKDYNLFVGVGRGEGLIMMSLYSLTFLFMSLFGKFQKRHILYFSISSILINSIAILQYIGFNPFNIYQDGIGTHNVSFMATIGNVSFISATFCLLLPVSFTAFIFLDNESKYHKLIHILSILMGAFIFGIIDVLSGKVAFLVGLILLIPYILTNNKRLSRLLIMVSTILSAYCINVIINPEYYFKAESLVFNFQFNYIVILYIIVIAILILLSKYLKKIEYDISDNKKVIKYFYLFIVICGILALFSLYFLDLGSGMLHEIHEILHGNFDDDFGTYRIFLWKRTFKIFPEFPILGSGPDSFAIRFMARFTEDIAAIGPLTINDTAANVYLTMLINIGIVGLTSYLIFIVLQIINGLKNMNNYSKVLFITIICYLVQDCFNLSVVIVTPIFWLLMAMHYNSTIQEDKKDLKKNKKKV